MSVLVVMEQKSAQQGSTWHRTSLEALSAAQQLAASLNLPCEAAVLGSVGTSADSAALAATLTPYNLAAIWQVEHPLLTPYTADAFTSALQQLIAAAAPQYVVFPHTYQVRDYAPALATRLDQVLISDVTAIAPGPVFTRQWMQGKLNADCAHAGDGICLISVQAGSFRSDATVPGTAPSTAPIKPFTPTLDPALIRTRPAEPHRAAAQAVDLSTAPVIVSVGRGIGEQENLTLVEDLATALHAELAASRPICDAGWLPMERQVGSSGQTVAPTLYVAIGISGAIQHLVGMKAARTVLAINKDEAAPIFEIADIGVVGDLFEIVPALTKAIQSST